VARESAAHGHYLAGEVGLLAGVSGDRIGQWARWGYIRSSHSDGEPRVYGYEDVAEAIIVHELEELGAGLQAIRRAVERLRAREDAEWPLQRNARRLGAANGSVVEFEGDQAYDLGGPALDEQGVLRTPDLRRIAADLERGGWASRLLGDVEHVQVDPAVLDGRPVVRGRRIAAQEVAELAAAPGGCDTLRDDYELTPAEIDDAIRWWRAASSFEGG
jgi:uncharacterized protein (DUF433 family)/DNA-binding transcriptional MerR regulator